ncbi:MAG: geranylgeranylglyceryl/heptaprenylglyceryl phosphate synthase, partial [Ignavibacteriales bacterium]|nr:geranylgeranylglyceryl/heptaprenylglyceryl phosphate synthase [Ignavibacteriales bacterium]
MRIYNHIQSIIEKKGAFYFILLDPDKINGDNLVELIGRCEEMGVDGFLIGGSLMLNGDFEKTIDTIKSNSKLPAVIFPGDVNQISPKADAILFL